MSSQCPAQVRDSKAQGGVRQCRHLYDPKTGAKDCGRHKKAIQDTPQSPLEAPLSDSALLMGTIDAEELQGTPENTFEPPSSPPSFVHHGSRDATGTDLPVDAGCVAVGTNESWLSMPDDWNEGYDGENGWAFQGNFISLTTYGDGLYPMLKVYNKGEVAGVEVVFDLSEEMETWRSNPDNIEVVENEIYNDETDEWETVEEEIELSDQEVFDYALDEDPAGQPEFKMRIRVAEGGSLNFGDPCYGEPSASVKVPAGEYGVYVHVDHHERPIRLGAYRLS